VIGAAAPAHAFTPPIGSDKGSVIGDASKYYDMSSPYLLKSEFLKVPDIPGPSA
jgi:hypothetical protein